MGKIQVTIDQVGRVKKMEVNGVVGESCRGLTAPYLRALGAKAEDITEEIKSEMYQTATETEYLNNQY